MGKMGVNESPIGLFGLTDPFGADERALKGSPHSTWWWWWWRYNEKQISAHTTEKCLQNSNFLQPLIDCYTCFNISEANNLTVSTKLRVKTFSGWQTAAKITLFARNFFFLFQNHCLIKHVHVFRYTCFTQIEYFCEASFPEVDLNFSFFSNWLHSL